MPSAYIEIRTTTEKRADAERIASALVKKRLAACAQIVGPIKSTYWWKGKIETAREYMCVIKTRRSLYKKVEKAIKALHPYETPEIIALPIVAGSTAYLKWLCEETGRAK